MNQQKQYNMSRKQRQICQMFMQQKYHIVDEFVRKNQNRFLSKCALLLHDSVHGHHIFSYDIMLVWFMEVRLAFKQATSSLSQADSVLLQVVDRLVEVLDEHNIPNSSRLIEDIKTLYHEYVNETKSYLSDMVLAYVARGIACKIPQTARFVIDTLRNTSIT